MDLKKLYATQISLTEWFEKIGHARAREMRVEDNEKRERLRVLNERIGLPFDRPFQCAAADIADRTPAFMDHLAAHGDELCALRLIPLDPELPKLRMRGMTVAEVATTWFAEQGIDATKYRADFVPHPADHVWSTIFVVNEHGAFGEIIRGSHNQLTQGFHDEGGGPVSFSWDFNENSRPGLSPGQTFFRPGLRPGREAGEAEAYLGELIAMLRVEDAAVRDALARDINATFANDHLVGYFETVASSAFGTWFIDYNRLLADGVYQPEAPNVSSMDILTGRPASRGVARGRVRVVIAEELDVAAIGDGDILVCVMTTPDHLHLMRRAGAIVTDLGGILTHAAITCRELGKPCVVGTKNATSVLREGDLVEVDADRGVVRRAF